MDVGDTVSPRLSFPVVGIGASAGGLEAFTEFFDAMPPGEGIAFVLVQHLSPKRESMVAEILQKHTHMPVLQVEDGMPVEPDHVYVIAPGRTMTIKDGRLHLGDSLLKSGHSRPVDDFFRSLAEEQREQSVCVILSGMGSNGTAGAQAIKVVGGVGFAQEPESAKYPSMPRSMIDAGLADFILKPKEMPEVLLRHVHNAYVSGTKSSEAVAQVESRQIAEILAILRARLRQDFAGYKKPTVVRRIQRRMSLTQQATMADYARLLRQTPAEVTNLSDDLMIHVTGFFRDREVWDGLRERVILPLVNEKHDRSPIRAWVTACASGEEAYTLAMLLVEAAESVDKQFDIKVFATDMAERALSQARAGLFPGGIESEISPERLSRFFDKDESMYRVKKDLRDLVVFAPQNVLQDPPFSRLDIVTCRNLLIYLEPDVQQRVLSLLHFGLRENGTLVLGNSETIGDRGDMFEPIDKKLRLYRRIGPTRHIGIDFPTPSLSLPSPGDASEPRILSRASLGQVTNKLLLDTRTPPSVVIDRHGRIVYFHGNTAQYLDQPQGEPTRDLLALAHDFVRGGVRTAINRVTETGVTTVVKDGVMQLDDQQYRIEITADPMDRRGMPGYYLISFDRYPVSVMPITQGDDKSDAELAVELRRARDELQTSNEALQTSNEELKASNEEITSINEELQSTNEELETSKEELQSLNEELATVNAQLQVKMLEQESTGNDLTCLLSSTDIAVIFLDRQFRIRRYTPAVRTLIDLIASDVGRPLNALAWSFDDPDLMADAAAVLERLTSVEREMADRNGRWYQRRVLPYRTTDDRIDGVVITFVNVTERRIAEQRIRDSDERIRLLVKAGTEALYRMNADWSKMLALEGNSFLSDAAQSNQDWVERYIPPDDRPTVTAAIARAVAAGSVFESEHRVIRADGSVGWTFSRAVPILGPDGRIAEWFGIATDITDRKQGESDRASLLQAEQHARLAAENASAAKDQFLANVSHELRTPLSAILMWSKLLGDVGVDAKTLSDGLSAIDVSARSQQKLIEDLLDTARIATGKLVLDLKPTDLAATVGAAVDTVRPAAGAKGVDIHTDFGSDVGHVLADADRLKQVVWNLLSNALKFTPAGGRIDVGLWRHDGTVEIRVADTGVGIAPEQLADIFGRFHQVDPSSTRHFGGLGLGLAISRQLIELHGGTINAASVGIGHGSVFTVYLPMPRHTAAAPPPAADKLSGVRVLLVEDDERTRDVVTRVLQQAGAIVEAFGHPDPAKAAFTASPPDVLLSDIGLPDKDGYTLIRELRAGEPDGQRVPALAFTAFDRPQDRALAASSGFDDYLTKPVDPARLVQALHKLLMR